jgi:hypothetical protein
MTGATLAAMALAAVVLGMATLALVVWLARRDRPRLRLSVLHTAFALMPPPMVRTTPGLAIRVVNQGRKPVTLPGWVVLVLADGSTFALRDPAPYQGRVWGARLRAGEGWSVLYPRVLWQRERAAGRAACVGVNIADAGGKVWQVRLRRDLAEWFNGGAGTRGRVTQWP